MKFLIDQDVYAATTRLLPLSPCFASRVILR